MGGGTVLVWYFDDAWPNCLTWQEQRENDETYKNLELRLNILKLLGTSSDTTADANADLAKQIMKLCEQDEYFGSAEAHLVPECIQVIGYMEACRNSLDLLQSVDAVIFLELFEALSQCHQKNVKVTNKRLFISIV